MELYSATHKAIVNGKEFNARKSGKNWYYHSIKTGRWIPTSKDNIINAD